jgi:hypothetical protein
MTKGGDYLSLVPLPPSLKQRNDVPADNSRESSHRSESNVRVAGFNPRDILLSQASPLSQLSLGQASIDSGRAEVLAKDDPQIVGNGLIALRRFLRRPPRHPVTSYRF